MSPRADRAGALVKTSACPAGLTLCSAAGLVFSRPGLGVGAGVISRKSPAASFFRVRTDNRVITSRKATARAMSPRAGIAGALVKTSACPAGLTLCSAAGLVFSGPGLGVGVISGKSPAAFPAPTKVVLTFGMGPGMAAAWMAPRRPAAPPGPMSELVALFGFGGGPGGGTPPGPVELAAGVGLEDAEDVVLADAEGVGLAVGAGDVEGSELVLGVGAGGVESVGLGVDVGGGDVEGVALSLVAGTGVDGDGLGVPEGPGVTLAPAGEGEGEEANAFASAGSSELADSPEMRKPPVTRPATIARRRATDI